MNHIFYIFCVIFFFKQKTAYEMRISDWSSDVCSSDLLTPTRIYVAGARAGFATGGVRALAHITGGGLIENLPRVLPAGLVAGIDTAGWPLPPVFRWQIGRAHV